MKNPSLYFYTHFFKAVYTHAIVDDYFARRKTERQSDFDG